jgi:hypothetical protein
MLILSIVFLFSCLNKQHKNKNVDSPKDSFVENMASVKQDSCPIINTHSYYLDAFLGHFECFSHYHVFRDNDTTSGSFSTIWLTKKGDKYWCVITAQGEKKVAVASGYLKPFVYDTDFGIKDTLFSIGKYKGLSMHFKEYYHSCDSVQRSITVFTDYQKRPEFYIEGWGTREHFYHPTEKLPKPYYQDGKIEIEVRPNKNMNFK